jgi:hypothetical protein
VSSELAPTLQPFFIPIAEKLAQMFLAPKLNKSVAVNVAITFGRLGLLDPQTLSSRFLEGVLKPWCLSVRTLASGPEKESAFRGICFLIPHNPASALTGPAFPYLCQAFVSYKEPPEALRQMFQEIIIKGKEAIGDQWSQYVREFPEQLREGLKSKFGVSLA